MRKSEVNRGGVKNRGRSDRILAFNRAISAGFGRPILPDHFVTTKVEPLTRSLPLPVLYRCFLAFSDFVARRLCENHILLVFRCRGRYGCALPSAEIHRSSLRADRDRRTILRA